MGRSIFTDSQNLVVAQAGVGRDGGAGYVSRALDQYGDVFINGVANTVG